jgi:hypothetical protein
MNTITKTGYWSWPALLLATTLAAQDVLPDLHVPNSAGRMVDLTAVQLIKAEPDGLRVSHSTGMTKVPYEFLPADLKLKYGFDPSEAHQYRETVTVRATLAAAVAETPSPESVQPITPTPSAPVAGYCTPKISSVRSRFTLSRSTYNTPSCRPGASGFPPARPAPIVLLVKDNSQVAVGNAEGFSATTAKSGGR